MEDIPPERKFLHDLATPLTVAKGAIKKIQSEFTKTDGTELDRELCITRLNKTMESLKKIEDLHADFRAYLQQKDARKLPI